MLASRTTSAPSDGSRTLTVQDAQPTPSDDAHVPLPTLRLRGGPRSRPRIAWDDRVIDNENCGKKKSKICCIYHKPKAFDESSDESSDEDSDADTGGDGRARPPHNHHHHHHGDDRDDRHHHIENHASEGGMRVPVEVGDTDEPNAYESVPKNGKGLADS